MNGQIQYRDENIGEVRLVPDFLPSPQELAMRAEQTKLTISLSSDSVAFFKETARKHDMKYQKMIRQLLDDYVARHKEQ
jgi:predicted DNA binding CopG/RHH family protein